MENVVGTFADQYTLAGTENVGSDSKSTRLRFSPARSGRLGTSPGFHYLWLTDRPVETGFEVAQRVGKNNHL
jgi:hypothetical protein